MDLDGVNTGLRDLAALVNQYSEQSRTELEKFQIALTGTLKLLSSSSPTLKGLHGTPEEVQGYLLQQASTLSHTIETRFEDTLGRIDDLLMKLETVIDRNS